MFIRKKINKNGAFSVLLIMVRRVPGKKHPVSKIIKNFGSAREGPKLETLVQKAEVYKSKLKFTSPKIKRLNLISDLDVNSCRSYNTGFSDIYGTIYNTVFGNLNMGTCLKNKLHDLIVMRIASPASKLKTSKIASEYNIDLGVDTIYKSMDQITLQVVNDTKKTIYEHTKKLLAQQKETIDVLFYDLTTLSFETSTQDGNRNFGFSKDGKHQHVQIMLAVAVTKDGLPITYEEFPGNFYEGHTLIPVLNELEKRYNIDKVVLVADAALMNNINLKELDKRNIKYIIAARIKNSTKETQAIILNADSYETIKEIPTADPTKVDKIKAKIIELEDDLLIAYHSSMRAHKDENDREKGLEKIKSYINSSPKSSLISKLKKPYVTIKKGSKITIDLDKLNEAKQYDGFFGIRTNIKAPNPLDILSYYGGLWQIEETFRISKTDLEIRPIFHYNPDRIRAHILICYMALSLIRYVQFTLKTHHCYIPFEQLHLLLDKMRKVEIIDSNNELFEIAENLPCELIPVYKALNANWPNKFAYRANL
jgi:transposase